MEVKSELIAAQMEHITDAEEAAAGKQAGRTYFNTDKKELAIADGAILKRISSGPSMAIGDVRSSFLTETQFQAEVDTTWVLCDGRNISGADLHVLIPAFLTIPDLRGMFLRGKNEGRVDGKENPDGEIALGDYQADEFASHSHTIPAFNSPIGGGQAAGASTNAGTFPDTDPTGGNETRAKNVTVNYFIKINR